MEFFTRVLSGNSRTNERSREAQQITETFDSSLKDDLKVILDSEESIHVSNLLDMIYDTSFPEEKKFMKMPSQDLLKSKEDLVNRLLTGLDHLGVPSMADMLLYIKKYGTEGIEEMLIKLFQLMSPCLEEKQLPEYTADDVLDDITSQWHGRSGVGSPLLSVMGSATSSPRGNAASVSDTQFPSSSVGSPLRRVLAMDRLQAPRKRGGEGGAPCLKASSMRARHKEKPEIHTLKSKRSFSERLMPLVSREEEDKNVQMNLGQNLEDIYRLDSLKHSQEPPVLAKTELEENLKHIIQNCWQLPSELNNAEEDKTSKDDTSVLTPGKRVLHIENGSRSVMHEPRLSAEQDPVGPELSFSGKVMPSGLPVCREEDDEFAQTHAGKNVEDSFRFDSSEQSQQHSVVAKIELGDHLRPTSLLSGQLLSELFSAKDAESTKDDKAGLSCSKMDLQVDKSGRSLMHEPLLLAEQGDGPEMHTLGPEQRSSEKAMPRVFAVYREEDAENVQMHIGKNVEGSFLHGFPQHFQPHNVLAKIDLGEHFNQVSRHSRELPSELTTLAEDETTIVDKAVRVPLMSNSENEAG